MLILKGAVVKESLVLSHPGVEWDIIVLDPTSKWVKKQDWVLVALLKELLSGVLK